GRTRRRRSGTARRRAPPGRAPPTRRRSARARSSSAGAGTRPSARSAARAGRARAALPAATGSAPASPAGRRGSARRAAPHTRRPGDLPHPSTVLLDDLAVQLDPPAAAELLDHVPVDRAPVLAADEREAGADREMDGAVDLLVEERVPRVPLDPGVAADPELAEAARALVGVERGEQELLVPRRRRVDDLARLEAQPHALADVPLVGGRELRELDDALSGVLEGRVEELAARHVVVRVVDEARAAVEREGQVGARTDDPHRLRRVEALGVAGHPVPLGVPVQEAGAVDEVLEV